MLLYIHTEEINNQRETNTFTDFFDFGINHCEYKTFKALIHREVNNKFVSAACNYMCLLDSMVNISQGNNNGNDLLLYLVKYYNCLSKKHGKKRKTLRIIL